MVLVLVLAARRRVENFWERVRLGFAILGDRRKFVLGVIVPQAISWVFRIASLFFFLRAFRVDATVHNALLVQVVDSLATLFPATPGGAGTKQGLIVYLFRRSAISGRSARVQRRHNRHITSCPGRDRDRAGGADAPFRRCAGGAPTSSPPSEWPYRFPSGRDTRAWPRLHV